MSKEVEKGDNIGHNALEEERFRIAFAIREALRKDNYRPVLVWRIDEYTFSWCFASLLVQRANEIINESPKKVSFKKALGKAFEECLKTNPDWLRYCGTPFSCREQMEEGKKLALERKEVPRFLTGEVKEYLEKSELVKTAVERERKEPVTPFEALGLFIWACKVRVDEVGTEKTLKEIVQDIKDFSFLFHLVRSADSIRREENIGDEEALAKAYYQIVENIDSVKEGGEKEEIEIKTLKTKALKILNNKEDIREGLLNVLPEYAIGLLGRVSDRIKKYPEKKVRVEIERFGKELFMEGTEHGRIYLEVSRLLLPMAEYLLGEEV